MALRVTKGELTLIKEKYCFNFIKMSLAVFDDHIELECKYCHKIHEKIPTIEQDSFYPNRPNRGKTPNSPESENSPQTRKPLRKIFNQPLNVSTSNPQFFSPQNPNDTALKHFKLRAMV